MREIVGAFRTRPVAALEATLGLARTDIALEYKQQSYAARLFTLPDDHTILHLCLNTFPKTLDREHEKEALPNLIAW
jgi:hypothetical protein